jgi:hypothetical protein
MMRCELHHGQGGSIPAECIYRPKGDKNMSPAHHKTSRPQPASSAAAKSNASVIDGELAVFSLRDTLNGIKVREANFSEFLQALKQYGTPATRS